MHLLICHFIEETIIGLWVIQYYILRTHTYTLLNWVTELQDLLSYHIKIETVQNCHEVSQTFYLKLTTYNAHGTHVLPVNYLMLFFVHGF
jgi:hypothetical protein